MALEIRVVDSSIRKNLSEFFRDLKNSGEDKFFHPHPLTDSEAKKLVKYSGKDLYYVLTEGNKIIGYGMLRGWDEGFEIPSLGIVIHPAERRNGLGKMLMLFLHSAAKRRGCHKIRLKVYQENTKAIQMYKKVGYRFTSCDVGQLVGFIDL